jgi:hypothetical protein
MMAIAPAVSGAFSAAVYPTTEASPPLTVSQFIAAQTPGNVAVCLSGGGSRALSAGMGQLTGLAAVQLTPNVTLFSQVKALSTVSGGSWVGVPFVYLPDSTSDTNYVGGPYINPHQLTPTGLGTLPNTAIGSQITHDFSIEDMLFQALLLHWQGVPTDMLWQTVIGLHLLAPYGLFPVADAAATPNSFFTYNEATLEAIRLANPSLQQATASLVSTRPRPYLVCNTAMFVTQGGQSLLAPVQATSFMTGILSVPPNATDANGLQVGGGGVESFAFNSGLLSFHASTSRATVQQRRQWALVDIVGASSAAFAASLAQLASSYARSPDLFAATLRTRGPAAVNFLARHGVPTAASRTRLAPALAAHAQGDVSQIRALAMDLEGLIPVYQYWPVLNPPVNQPINPSQFADGGSLENSGVAAMLAYHDIQHMIAFTNTSTPLSLDRAGTIVVDDSIPPLFGYQPYVEGTGYVPYQGATDPNGPLYRNNQVFPSEAFWDLLNNLWTASGSGTYQTSPMYAQPLITVTNPWFNVQAGRSVTVLWVYLERVHAWYQQLSPEVQNMLGPFDHMLNSFPHYGTLDTELTATEINLLANFTAWVILSAPTAFTALFPPAVAASEEGPRDNPRHD